MWYYVPVEYVPYSLRAANAGCVHRSVVKATWQSGTAQGQQYARSVGSQRCQEIWKTTAEWRMYTWYHKYTVVPAWCLYYAPHYMRWI